MKTKKIKVGDKFVGGDAPITVQSMTNTDTKDVQATVNQYSDIDIDQWYAPYVSFALSLNFLERTLHFDPTAGMTRGDAAILIYKIAVHNENMAVQ